MERIAVRIVVVREGIEVDRGVLVGVDEIRHHDRFLVAAYRDLDRGRRAAPVLEADRVDHEVRSEVIGCRVVVDRVAVGGRRAVLGGHEDLQGGHHRRAGVVLRRREVSLVAGVDGGGIGARHQRRARVDEQVDPGAVAAAVVVADLVLEHVAAAVPRTWLVRHPAVAASDGPVERLLREPQRIVVPARVLVGVVGEHVDVHWRYPPRSLRCRPRRRRSPGCG